MILLYPIDHLLGALENLYIFFNKIWQYASQSKQAFQLIGMAGLAVTYGLNLNARMSRWILSFCKLENRIISVERIYQYCKIPSEAPLIIENCRPPSSWPENGNIELIDLKVNLIHSHLFLTIHLLSIYSIFSSSKLNILQFYLWHLIVLLLNIIGPLQG